MVNEQASQSSVMRQDSIQLVVSIPVYLYDFMNQLLKEGSNKNQIASRMLTRVLYKQQRDFMSRMDTTQHNQNKEAGAIA